MSIWDQLRHEGLGHAVGWTVAALLSGIAWLIRAVVVGAVEREATRRRLDSIDRRLEEIDRYLREGS